MRVDEYAGYDATGLAELIRTGAVPAKDVQAAAAAAIDSVSAELNPLVGQRFEVPLEHAADGPFGGVPFALKDLVLHAAGVPQRGGTRLFGPGIPFPADTYLMARFRAAGLAVLAMTATPELGFNASTEPVSTGAVHNPWDTTRSPGGSSGGSAALVASRALPIAHANDGGGSIRIPAGACGLVGLKPTRGRTSPGPDEADPLMGMGIEFALTRTVRDCAALLDVVHGSEPGDRYLLPVPATSFAEAALAGSRPLRIAVSTTPTSKGTVDPECVSAVRGVADQLEGMGHTLTEATPPVDGPAFDEAILAIWTSYLADGVDLVAGLLGAPVGPQTLEATTLACVEHGRTVKATELYAAQRVANMTTRSVAAFFGEYDVLLTPTTCAPNTPLGQLYADVPDLDARGWLDRVFGGFAGFTALANMTGMPAISLPLGWSQRGWPIGVQFQAGLADEATLLALAGDLERALPWADRRPAVVAH